MHDMHAGMHNLHFRGCLRRLVLRGVLLLIVFIASVFNTAKFQNPCLEFIS